MNHDRVYTCPKVAMPPSVDGRIDDDAWTHAPAVTLVLSETGKPAGMKTTMRMCWDAVCLYVAFDCIDEDIWGTFTNRDDPIYDEEVVEAFICPSCDLTRYFEFEVSPRNVAFDAKITNLGVGHEALTVDTDWDCEGFRSAVVVDGTLDDRTAVDRGWTVEMAIPFASLERETPRPGERWRINLYRIDRAANGDEYQAWSPTLVDPADFHVPSRFGTIVFEATPKTPTGGSSSP